MEINIYLLNQQEELEIHKETDFLKQLNANDRVWIDVETDQAKDFEVVAEKYGLHELAVEDCFTRGHFPKLEEYPGYNFIMLRGLKSHGEIEEIHELEEYEEEYNSEKLTRSIAIFMSENFIITHRLNEVPWFDAVLRQIKQHPELFTNFNPQEFTHRIADILTSRFLRGINFFEDQIDELEDDIIKHPDEFDMLELLDLKRDLNILLSIMRDQKNVFSRLAMETGLIQARQLRRYFKNIDDRASTILQGIQRLVDNLASVRDVYLTMSNVRLGDIMRILAVITTIAAPLHLVVGLYGMNFEAIPLLHDKNGFWLIVLAMLGLAIAMLVFFRKQKWI